jgi:hypothetical protein
LTGVVFEEGEKEISLVQVTLKRLQDDVQHSVGVKGESTYM